jgi:hypothetical protein
MKRPLRLIIVLAGIVFIAAIVGTWWLREDSAQDDVPVPFKEDPPPLVSNLAVAAEPPASPEPPKTVSRIRPRPSEIVGIGAVVKVDANTGALMIVGVVPNSPAAAAGLAGDFLIRKIDDRETDGMKLGECVDLLRGAPGTKVRLDLLDPDANEARPVELTREKLQVDALPPARALP